MRNQSEIKTWWDEGVQAGWIGVYEQEMIRAIEAAFGLLEDEIKLCTVFLSLFVKSGHTSIPLSEKTITWAKTLGLHNDEITQLPKGHVDVRLLVQSNVVGSGTDMKPLIIHENLLSFRKIRMQELSVLQFITGNRSNNNISDISDCIGSVFPEHGRTEIDWQRTAVYLSWIRSFLIISGGPGTGKTTTVAKILALHQRASEEPLRVALAAPTGKAASRMGEALFSQLENMDLTNEELIYFPKEAKTIHRLLARVDNESLLPQVETQFLPYDLIIIDEASMIDLNMMYRLLYHTGPATTLILLGDKDQLASVEAGSVFSDLCQKPKNGFKKETIEQLQTMGFNERLPIRTQSQLEDSIIYLTKSYRFGVDTGIGTLAESVKSGNGTAADIIDVFETFPDIEHHLFSYRKEDFKRILSELVKRIEATVSIKNPTELLVYWKESIWLSVLRRGLGGTERLNRLVEQQLSSRRVVKPEQGWYHGRPVIITQNDYNLGLFNGDHGVCIKDLSGELWLHVESGAGIKRIKPERVVHYTPAYFLTVHKSQGSEFNHVNFLLPGNDHSLLTKELIYTAITRSKKSFTLYGEISIFCKGIARFTQRYTGLKKMVRELQ